MILYEECQEADKMLGCHGVIALPVFQSIMADYDLHFLQSDKDDLHHHKYLILDED